MTIQINCGGSAISPYVADTYYTGGNGAGGGGTIDVTGVTNPAPQGVYACNRWGYFGYLIPGLTVGAVYTVRLHFAEIHFTAAGSRVFNMSLNGSQVLTNFDIIATAGAANKAVIQQFSATADSTGSISLTVSGVRDNPMLSAIEVTLAPIPTTTTLTSSLNPSLVGQSVTFTATVTPNSGSVAPTGTVTFYDGATVIGTGMLS